jgi:Arm DNA-binding domain
MGLSQTRADKIKQPGRYADGRNLYLQVSAAGNRSWVFRYELHGPIADMGHHSITSSALASSAGGTVIPRALAVLRLMTSSYLFGACTGKLAGFSPLRMRST